MNKFSSNQRKVVADILVNLGIAWVSIGTISQIVFKMENAITFLLGLILFFIFAISAIVMVK